MTEQRTVLITGASAGIGAAFAHEFARHGYNLILVARRADKLETLAAELRTQADAQVNILPMDLAREDAAAEIYSEISAQNINVDALVNNAGYALNGGLLDSSWTEQQAMLQVMLTGYSELTHRFLPGMIERSFGRIINVSSLSAFAPPTAGSTYSAIKRYINDFSVSVDFEFRDRGIHCCAVCPGFTYTEFHDVMGVREQTNQYPKFVWQSAADVASEGYEAVMSGRVIRITGRLNRCIAALLGLIPRALLLRLSRP